MVWGGVGQERTGRVEFGRVGWGIGGGEIARGKTANPPLSSFGFAICSATY